MTEHAPGPWEMSWNYNQRRLSVKSGYAEVAVVRALINQGANARLIAAAPEMLKALRVARGYVGDAEGGSQARKDFERIDAVIVKATGE